MIQWMIRAMIYLGSALMVYNIVGFVRFARYIRTLKAWNQGDGILYLPIVLLIFFLLGYLIVGFFGKPDIVMAGILFGGSIFVFVMYRLLSGITRKVVEGERLRAELMAAEESNRAKNSFLASVSHEMRTPMNVILGVDGIALKRSDLSDEVRAAFEKIGHSGRHLSGLIDNMLDMHRIETGELVVRTEPFSLGDVLSQINAIAATSAGEKGLDYAATAEEALGDYRGDAILIKRVLLAILDNAVKYTDAGSVKLDVTREAAGDGAQTLCFSVTDTGIGIDPAFLPRMFDVFTQEDASFTNRYGGSGMSLAIAKHIVAQMGGDISVHSVKGQGSAFTVRVPLEPIEPPAADTAPTASEVSLEGRRILIVEDIDDNAEILGDLLELEGAESERAKNGLDAVRMVERSPENYYDAILMDLRMPVMDGLESARQIRALPRPDAQAVPIIALTANAFESDVQNTLDAGMNEHLAKPTDADELYSAIKRWIATAPGTERR